MLSAFEQQQSKAGAIANPTTSGTTGNGVAISNNIQPAPHSEPVLPVRQGKMLVESLTAQVPKAAKQSFHNKNKVNASATVKPISNPVIILPLSY